MNQQELRIELLKIARDISRAEASVKDTVETARELEKYVVTQAERDIPDSERH